MALVNSTSLCAWRNNKSATTVACHWIDASVVALVAHLLDYVISRWIVAWTASRWINDSLGQARRTAKQHHGHWVSGPSALVTSCLQLQDLSARLSLSLCLSIAGLMSLCRSRTALMSRGGCRHWISGPSALVTSCQRLQDLSIRLSLSLCLSIAGLMSLRRRWTTLKSRWSNGHWGSGPSSLVVDYLRLHRLQSGQRTTVDINQVLHRTQSVQRRTSKLRHRHRVSGPSALMSNRPRLNCAVDGSK